MKKSSIYRLPSNTYPHEELIKLRHEINVNKEAFLQSIEENWHEFQDGDQPEWPENNWHELQKKIDLKVTEDQSANVFRLHWWIKAAAILFILVSIWVVFRANYGGHVIDEESPALITRINDSNAPETVILKDGTRVILTAHSSLSYYENFNSRYRVVHLDGEAYFETQEENTRPFIVISDNITSICRGNEFSISAYKNSNEINVTSAQGQIEISQNNRLNSEANKIAVHSCQRFSFNKDNQEYLIGKIGDCDFDEHVQRVNKASSKTVVRL